MRNIFSNKFYIRLIAITLCFFLAPSQSIAQLSSAGAAGSASHPGPPSPIGCTVGDSVVLVDNIGRDVSNGFGPLWADRAPSDNTYGFLSMNNADEPSSVQTYVALSVVRAEHTVKLSAVEAVLAQAGPNGTGNANPFNLNATPANFAFLIYNNFEEVLTNPPDPLYKECFAAAS
ncbi:MAG: hypothetical protein KDD55_12895, partial [Bdellovibrionales bacterium]|nr:hypothetical protein [Bdellovibrionales bacterium]